MCLYQPLARANHGHANEEDGAEGTGSVVRKVVTKGGQSIQRCEGISYIVLHNPESPLVGLRRLDYV